MVIKNPIRRIFEGCPQDFVDWFIDYQQNADQTFSDYCAFQTTHIFDDTIDDHVEVEARDPDIGDVFVYIWSECLDLVNPMRINQFNNFITSIYTPEQLARFSTRLYI